MLPVRVAYDPTAPVMTAGAFAVGERKFGPDELFPWVELGLSEVDLVNLWRAGYVRFLATGERVEAETPKQARRRQRRTQPAE